MRSQTPIVKTLFRSSESGRMPPLTPDHVLMRALSSQPAIATTPGSKDQPPNGCLFLPIHAEIAERLNVD